MTYESWPQIPRTRASRTFSYWIMKIIGFPAMQEMLVRSLVGKIPWRKKLQPTSVFLPGKYHGQRNLVGYSLLLLLLLSRSSRVPTLCDPIDGSPSGSPSLGFSRQEHWSGPPFPPPMRESEIAQSCLTLSDPMDCSLPGSSVHGIFQARVLEWVAIAFSRLQSMGLQKSHTQLCN